MGIDYKGSQIPTAFASCSISYKPGKTLRDKLQAIKKSGFDGIEISMPDILEYGKVSIGREPAGRDFDAIVEVSKQIKSLTEEIGLKVYMLQPFSRFEGWKAAGMKQEADDALERARGWIRVMEAIGTDILQIGSSDAQGITSSIDEMAADLANLADICAEKGLRIAYENWCWATRASTWKAVWQVVEKANRPNLGLCLDTFQAAGAELADPTTQSGLIETVDKVELEARWQDSLEELSRTVPADRIFLLQISDGYKMSPPIPSEGKDGQPPLSVWSHDYRPLPGAGGYLPVREFLEAVLKTGFRGLLSMEVFDTQGEGKVNNEEYTASAMESLKSLLSAS